MRLRSWILLGCLAWPYPIYAEIPIDSMDYDVPVTPLPTEKYQFEILNFECMKSAKSLPRFVDDSPLKFA